jgi:hypothetical protein
MECEAAASEQQHAVGGQGSAVGSPASSSTLVALPKKAVRGAMKTFATASLCAICASADGYVYIPQTDPGSEVISHVSTSRPPVLGGTIFGVFCEAFDIDDSLSTDEFAAYMLSGLRDACNDGATSMTWNCKGKAKTCAFKDAGRTYIHKGKHLRGACFRDPSNSTDRAEIASALSGTVLEEATELILSKLSLLRERFTPCPVPKGSRKPAAKKQQQAVSSLSPADDAAASLRPADDAPADGGAALAELPSGSREGPSRGCAALEQGASFGAAVGRGKEVLFLCTASLEQLH